MSVDEPESFLNDLDCCPGCGRAANSIYREAGMNAPCTNPNCRVAIFETTEPG